MRRAPASFFLPLVSHRPTLYALPRRRTFRAPATTFSDGPQEDETASIYQRELAASRMLDNGSPKRDTESRLQALREHRSRWLNLDPKQRVVEQIIVTKPVDRHIFDTGTHVFTEEEPVPLSEGCTSSRKLFAFRHSLSPPGGGEWTTYTMPAGQVVDLSIAAGDVDLLAYLVTTENIAEERKGEVQVHLRQLSTGSDHPLAKNASFALEIPDFDVYVKSMEWEDADIKICGDLIALGMQYWTPVGHDDGCRLRTTFQIFNWKTGQKLVHESFDLPPAFAFLDENTVIHSHANELDVCEVPRLDRSTVMDQSLHLPLLKSLCTLRLPRPTLGNIPNCFASFRSRELNHTPGLIPNDQGSNTPLFSPNPLHGLLAMTVEFECSGKKDCPLYRFVIGKEPLLRFINAAKNQETSHGQTLTLPWSTWGPSCTRIFPFKEADEEVPGEQVISGTRLALVDASSADGSLTLRVLDFNEDLVAHARRSIKNSGKITMGYKEDFGIQVGQVRLVDSDVHSDVMDQDNLGLYGSDVEPVGHGCMPYVETTRQIEGRIDTVQMDGQFLILTTNSKGGAPGKMEVMSFF